jgi:hypothetical protein
MQRRHAFLAALAALPLGLRAQRAEHQFVRAEYGARRRQIDVSATVAQLVQRGQSAQVGNALFGHDPAPGERKRLRVIARDRRGRERVFEFEEDAWFEAERFALAGGAVAGAEGWRILHARWGVGAANVDVTERLRELARSDRRFRVSNELFGADPAPGTVKSLRVVASDGRGRRQRFEFPEGSTLDGQQFLGWGEGDWGHGSGGWDDGGYNGPQRPSHRAAIEWAEYRAEDGRRMDVTHRLQEALDRQGRVDLVVGNRSLGGDPAPGVPKRLWVRWRTASGRSREASWAEDQRLVLP